MQERRLIKIACAGRMCHPTGASRTRRGKRKDGRNREERSLDGKRRKDRENRKTGEYQLNDANRTYAAAAPDDPLGGEKVRSRTLSEGTERSQASTSSCGRNAEGPGPGH